MLGFAVIEFDGLRIRRERIDVAEPGDAPERRSSWRPPTPARSGSLLLERAGDPGSWPQRPFGQAGTQATNATHS